MTTIQLTREHKEKLLEMVKALFPEYGYVKILDGTCNNCLPNTILLAISEKEYKQNEKFQLVHWFEFLLAHLCNKFEFRWHTSLGLISRINKMSGYNENNYKFNHPIDYVYEEFKKL